MAQMKLSTEKKLMDLENRTCGCQGGGGESGVDWGPIGVSRCQLLPLEWISNQILLCSTGSYV